MIDPGPTLHVRPRAHGTVDGVAWYVEQHTNTPTLVITLASGPPAWVFWQGPAPATLTRHTAPAHCASLITQWHAKPMRSAPIPTRDIDFVGNAQGATLPECHDSAMKEIAAPK